MRVLIRGFRHYVDQAVFEFEPGKFYQIQGESGGGKSTIFKAIHWCLYGKEVRVAPFTDKGARTEVGLEDIPGLVWLRRSTNPSTLCLKLNHEGGLLEGAAAQAKVQELFGCADTWLATSYLQQLKKHHVLNISAGRRMKIFNQIAFRTDRPFQLVQQFSTWITQTENELKVAQAQYQSAKTEFERLASQGQGHIDPSFVLESQALLDLKKELLEIEQQLARLQTQYLQAREFENKRAWYAEQQQQVEQELEGLPETDPARLQGLIEQKRTFDLRAQQQQQIQRRQRELAALGFEEPPPSYTPDELADSISRYRRHTEMKIKATQAGLSCYEPAVLRQETELLESSLNFQWIFPLKAKRTALEAEKESLLPKVNYSVTSERMEGWRAQLQQLERSRDVMACPQCQCALRHVGAGLELAQESLFDAELEGKLRKNLTAGANHLRGQERLAAIEQALAGMEEIPELPQQVVLLPNPEAARQRLTQLRKLEYVELPAVAADHIQKAMEWHRLQKELAELSSLGGSEASVGMPSEASDPGPALEALRTAGARRNQLCRRLDDLVRMQAELSCPESSSSELEAKMATLKELQESKRLAGRRGSLSARAMAAYKEVQLLHAKAAQLGQKVVDLKEMKRITVEVQHQTLTALVANVNGFLKSVCTQYEVFAHPISIRVELSKKVKSTGVEKSLINLHVSYKGCQDNAFDDISGGEEARVSLLLAVALHKAAGSFVLILDEPLSGLGPQDKDNLLEVLRDNLEGHLVLLAAHAVPGGSFDALTRL